MLFAGSRSIPAFGASYDARSELTHAGQTNFDVPGNVHRLEELDRSVLRGELVV